MSGHVLSNLLNKSGKRDKMRGLSSILSLLPNLLNNYTSWAEGDKMRSLPSILSLLPNLLNKFNNTRARMLYFIYHMT